MGEDGQQARLLRRLQHLVLSRYQGARRVVWATWQGSAVALALGLSTVITAYAFPNSLAGGLAFVLLLAGIGAGTSWALTREPVRQCPGWVSALVVYALILIVAHHIFERPWREAAIWKQHDWGTHHAILRTLVDGLRAGEVPTWVGGLTTGEVPFDLYPSLPYYLMAGAAFLSGQADNLPLVLTQAGMFVHVVTALGVARLARRFAPWPIAAGAGLVMLFDRGAGGVTGGWIGLLFWGVFHSAVAQCFWIFALASLIDMLRRPRAAARALFWLFALAGTISHPVGLVTAAGVAASLLAVALLARDIAPRRAIVALIHVVLIAALTAWVWMPLFHRLGLYAVHYGSEPIRVDTLIGSAATYWKFFSQLGAATAIGLCGVLAAAFSRRAGPTMLAFLGGLCLIGATEQLYVVFALGPSAEMARFSPPRLLAVAKAPVFVCAAFLLAITWSYVRKHWPGRWVLVVGALAALIAGWAYRGVRPFADSVIGEMRREAKLQVHRGHTDQLMAWAKERRAEMRPDAYARLLHETPRHDLYHVYAETGLPTAAVGGVANLFLRERIEDVSPASLRRFNVRWVIKNGGSPIRGDPATEVRFGPYRIREVRDWDGRFARVERGSGRAVVTRLDNAAVEVELRATDRPALVALGTGYYPRWRARDAAGRWLPVYAMPSYPGAKTRVVAAWVRPGKTVFTPDGRLPSDSKGIVWSVSALLAILAVITVWARPRWRWRALRKLAGYRRLIITHWRRPALVALVVMAMVLPLAGARSSGRTTAALQVGHAATGIATVEARRPRGTWRRCDYVPLEGRYRCGRLLQVRDTVAGLINDMGHSWPFQTPSIRLRAQQGRAEFRIQLEATLGGTYWTAARGGAATLEVGDSPALAVHGQRQTTFDDRDTRQLVVLTGTVAKTLDIVVVRTDTIDPDRNDPIPPDTAPAEL
ncbi:MAG: hypothetical protein MJE77_44290 [Proteobacteria bacterium]|nr:hypothetical protein [Pseudomonadota bacterium]